MLGCHTKQRHRTQTFASTLRAVQLVCLYKKAGDPTSSPPRSPGAHDLILTTQLILLNEPFSQIETGNATAHRHLRHFSLTTQPALCTLSLSQIEAGDATATAPGSTTVIWGTTINAEVLRTKVDHFLWNFKDPQSGQDKYTQLIAKVRGLRLMLERFLCWSAGVATGISCAAESCSAPAK